MFPPHLVRVCDRIQPICIGFDSLTFQSADLVQNLYLKELSGFKPTPVSASDSEGHVQKFAVPKAPKSPEETDLANELKEYETQAVEIEGQASTESGAVEQDWFEEDEDSAPAKASH